MMDGVFSSQPINTAYGLMHTYISFHPSPDRIRIGHSILTCFIEDQNSVSWRPLPMTSFQCAAVSSDDKVRGDSLTVV